MKTKLLTLGLASTLIFSSSIVSANDSNTGENESVTNTASIEEVAIIFNALDQTNNDFGTMAVQPPPGGSSAYTTKVFTHPATTVSPQQIQKEQNQYIAALAVSVLGLSFITAKVGESVAAVSGWISAFLSAASLPPNRTIAMPLRFQVTEYRYYLKKPTSTLAGYVDHYVKDLSSGKTYKLKRINIAKNGL
ncbi:hypothetical protein EVJ22_13530 [Exiguobacterium sp. SH0S7]|uniref:hypothetical protein n=1 Tax=Exiguobacterium sp. SH0S7 TaxID=2510951 RepID=UPI00103A8D31|nr:hypothetical protein [Exiguobacterium sp. SH0S7]TCI67873.1 hypothetical protein EVJ22_13530 [Exiguobacterium sp. SH0S7]